MYNEIPINASTMAQIHSYLTCKSNVVRKVFRSQFASPYLWIPCLDTEFISRILGPHRLSIDYASFFKFKTDEPGEIYGQDRSEWFQEKTCHVSHDERRENNQRKKKKNKKKTIVANDNGRKVFDVLSDRDIKLNRNRKQSSYQRHVLVVTPVE